MADKLLELKDLAGGHEPIQIFQNIDLTMFAGTSIGLFGPNGHGKTTLLLTISGIIDPWQGDIFFEGTKLNRGAARKSQLSRNINYDMLRRRRMDPKAIARAGLIHAAQGNLLFPEMTIAETLAIAPVGASGRADEKQSLDQVYSLFPVLHERRSQKTRYLSGGERQMLSVSAALMAAPKLLILDEPTLGLSPKVRGELSAAIRSIRESGVPLLVVDQDVEFLQSLIDTLYLFDHGRISGRIEKDAMPSYEEIMAMLFEGADH